MYFPVNNVVIVTSFRNDMYFPVSNLMILTSSFRFIGQSNFYSIHMASPHLNITRLPYNQLSSIIEYTIIGWPHSQNPSKITGRPCSNAWYQSNAICRKPLRARKWPRSSGDRRCSSIGHAMWKVIRFRDWATWQRSISVESKEMSVQRLSCNSLQWQ